MATTSSRLPAPIEPECSSEIECVSIRGVLKRAAEGRLRATGFRRGFVWNAADTAALIDSIYRGLPIGIAVLWRTSVRLRHETPIGSLGARSPMGVEHDYVLDGRQRLEALCRVFGPREQLGDETQYSDCCYDRAADDVGDRIVSMKHDQALAGRYVVLRSVFASEAGADGVRAAFERATIPLQIVRTHSSADVALLIERLHRAGVAAENFDLIRAWRWHDSRARGET